VDRSRVWHADAQEYFDALVIFFSQWSLFAWT